MGIAGWITNDPTVRAQVAEGLANAFPPIKDLIDETLQAIAAGAALTSLLGIIGLIWTVSQLYGALDLAFARIFSNVPERDIVRRTARGFARRRHPRGRHRRVHRPDCAHVSVRGHVPG